MAEPEKAEANPDSPEMDDLDRKRPGIPPRRIPLGPKAWIGYNRSNQTVELWVRGVKQDWWPHI